MNRYRQPIDTTTDTQTQILDAAERLLLEQGFSATSLRSVVQAANVNLSAVRYHFGSKEKLMVAVLKRAVEPIVAAQVQQLAALGEGDVAAPSVETIFQAFLTPLLEEISLKESEKAARVNFISRCLVDPALEDVANQEFILSRRLLTQAVSQVLPDLPRSEIEWKLDLAIVMSFQLLCTTNPFDSLLQRRFTKATESAVQQLVSFVTAGIT